MDALTLIKLGALAFGAQVFLNKRKEDAAKALKAEADAASVDSGNSIGTPPMAPAAGEGGNAAVAATAAKVDGAPSVAGATAGNTIPLAPSTGEPDAALTDELSFVPQPFGGVKFLGKTPGQLAAEGFVYGYATGDIVGVSGRILPDGEFGWIQSLPNGGLDVYQTASGGKTSR